MAVKVAMRTKTPTIVIVEAKTEKGKSKISYHGERWYLVEVVEKLKFSRIPGPYVIVKSRDGASVLCIKQENDLDFQYRILQ